MMISKQNNNKSNQVNRNLGTPDYNSSYQKILDNRSNQLNPNNPLYKRNK